MEKSSPPTFSSISCSLSSAIAIPLQAPNKSKRSKRPQSSARAPHDHATAIANGKRSSIYRGVTRHRWTGRYEAHLWDKNCWNPIQNKKGRQVYLGAYDDEEAAAHTYDLAALKYWGPETILNFPARTYMKEFKEMQGMSREEYLASLRRRSSGFSRGASKYRGVARHHHNGRWEARIGRVLGNKYLYLGTFNTQEEAAEAYDLAAIEFRGANAVTNFDVNRYVTCFPEAALQQWRRPYALPTMPEESDMEGGKKYTTDIDICEIKKYPTDMGTGDGKPDLNPPPLAPTPTPAFLMPPAPELMNPAELYGHPAAMDFGGAVNFFLPELPWLTTTTTSPFFLGGGADDVFDRSAAELRELDMSCFDEDIDSFFESFDILGGGGDGGCASTAVHVS